MCRARGGPQAGGEDTTAAVSLRGWLLALTSRSPAAALRRPEDWEKTQRLISLASTSQRKLPGLGFWPVESKVTG